MTTPMSNRMHRHTRPADFVSKSRKAEAMSFARPGSRAFSFTGEFPELADQQPVEARSRRRDYTVGRTTGSYHAIRQDDTARVPVIGRHGVSLMTGIGMFLAFGLVLFLVFVGQFSKRAAVLEDIAKKQDRINVLTVECAATEKDIASQSNDVNIRQEAVLLGLISSKGVDVQYLEAPQDAVITMADQTVVASLASIWGK